jgi:hypothetical protein
MANIVCSNMAGTTDCQLMVKQHASKPKGMQASISILLLKTCTATYNTRFIIIAQPTGAICNVVANTIPLK